MLLRKLNALLLGLALYGAAPVITLAQERPNGTTASTGSYLSLSTSFTSALSIHTTSPTLSPARLRTEPGHLFGAGIGYRNGDTRLEGHLIQGRLDADDIRFAERSGPLSGYFELTGVTADLYHDFCSGHRLRPYLGAGLGVLRFRADSVALAGYPPTVGSNTLLSYQFMAGVGYVSKPFRFSIGYRYMGLGEQDFRTGTDSLRADSLGLDAVQVGVQVFL